MKLSQNWRPFSELLLSTGDMPIVEMKVRRSDFWGAQVAESGELVGMNVLGRLLMELREDLKADDQGQLKVVKPLNIPDFLLFERSITTVSASDHKHACRERLLV